jgi:peptidoglycan/LPS O-acetylase OafA/YrhL
MPPPATWSDAGPVHPGYRKDIDGLRAIAVLAVIAFHAFPDAAPGGFVGVDVFFVISGYLISEILLGGLDRGTFGFRGFYARRIRRIFPALAVVMATCLVIGWFVLLASEYAQLGRHTVAGAAFVSNLLLWKESGYFDAKAELKPLLHLWSLGVEEQFYLVWPLALWLAWRTKFKASWLMLVVSVASFASNVVQVRSDPTAAFYSPASRFWELMLGGLLAYARLFPGTRLQALGARTRKTFDSLSGSLPFRPTATDATSVLGLASIATSIFAFNKELAFPGWWALLPTLGAFALIASGPDAWCNRTILSRRVLVLIGLVSFPLYLWHWPLLAFARIYASDTPGALVRAGWVLAAFVLATATWLIVERPIRFGGNKRGKLVLSCTALIVVGLAGCVVVYRDGFDTRFAIETRRYANFKYDYASDGRLGSCWLGVDQAADAFAGNCVDRPVANRPLIVLWGDSHAARFFPGLRAVAGARFRLAEFTRDSCFPILRRLGTSGPICMQGNDLVLSKIHDLQPATVVLYAHWTPRKAWSQPELVRWLIPTIRKLKRIGVRNVIVMGPAPDWKTGLPATLVALHESTGASVPLRTKFGLSPYVAEVDANMRAVIAADKEAFYFSTWSALCDSDGCLTRIGSNPDDLTAFDYGHLTTPGARYLAAKLATATNDFDPPIEDAMPGPGVPQR